MVSVQRGWGLCLEGLGSLSGGVLVSVWRASIRPIAEANSVPDKSQWCSIRSVSIALLNWTLLTSYIFIFGFTLSSLCYLSSNLEKDLKYIWQTSFYFYRAQGKVMFSKASVSHSVHRRRSPSSPHWTETTLQRDDLPGQRPPWTETSL